MTEEITPTQYVTFDNDTLKNIREIARESELFRDTIGVLNSYLSKNHGCVIAHVERDGVSGVVWSHRKATKGKIIFKDVSFAHCLRFALEQEADSD